MPNENPSCVLPFWRSEPWKISIQFRLGHWSDIKVLCKLSKDDGHTADNKDCEEDEKCEGRYSVHWVFAFHSKVEIKRLAALPGVAGLDYLCNTQIIDTQ